jgi:hypothetical protein
VTFLIADIFTTLVDLEWKKFLGRESFLVSFIWKFEEFDAGNGV